MISLPCRINTFSLMSCRSICFSKPHISIAVEVRTGLVLREDRRHTFYMEDVRNDVGASSVVIEVCHIIADGHIEVPLSVRHKLQLSPHIVGGVRLEVEGSIDGGTVIVETVVYLDGDTPSRQPTHIVCRHLMCDTCHVLRPSSRIVSAVHVIWQLVRHSIRRERLDPDIVTAPKDVDIML